MFAKGASDRNVKGYYSQKVVVPVTEASSKQLTVWDGRKCLLPKCRCVVMVVCMVVSLPSSASVWVGTRKASSCLGGFQGLKHRLESGPQWQVGWGVFSRTGLGRGRRSQPEEGGLGSWGRVVGGERH